MWLLTVCSVHDRTGFALREVVFAIPGTICALTICALTWKSFEVNLAECHTTALVSGQSAAWHLPGDLNHLLAISIQRCLVIRAQFTLLAMRKATQDTCLPAARIARSVCGIHSWVLKSKCFPLMDTKSFLSPCECDSLHAPHPPHSPDPAPVSPPRSH